MSIFRWVPAKNEGYSYPEIPLDWGEYSNLKPSQYAEVEFEGLKPKKPLYISPYLLTGFEQSNVLNENKTAYEYLQDFKVEPGLDLKYGINPNTTLDLTVKLFYSRRIGLYDGNPVRILGGARLNSRINNWGIGFEIIDDYCVTREEVRYTWISPDSARLQSHGLLIRNYHLNSVLDGSLLTYHVSPNWTFATKSGWYGTISMIYNYEFLQ